jgi:hypothetical protein
LDRNAQPGGIGLHGRHPPGTGWLDQYIYPDDQAEITAAIRHAIETKNVFGNSNTGSGSPTAPSAEP